MKQILQQSMEKLYFIIQDAVKPLYVSNMIAPAHFLFSIEMKVLVQ